MIHLIKFLWNDFDRPGEEVVFWTQLFAIDFVYGENDGCVLKVKTAQFKDSCLLWRELMI